MSQYGKQIRAAFRLDQSEANLLQQLAQREGVDQSKYLRAIIRNKEKAFTLSPDEVCLLRDNFANITRLGSNINQITYHLNSSAIMGKAGSQLVTQEITSDLEELLKKTNVLIEQTKQKVIELINTAK